MNWWKGQAEGRCLFGSNISEFHTGYTGNFGETPIGMAELGIKN
jgi:hypothetical protein